MAYAIREGRAAARSAGRTPLRARELAWLAALPVAAVVVPAIAVLGPPLSELLFPQVTAQFWPTTAVAPEPVEHGRYLIALTAPLWLVGLVALGARRAISAPPRTVALLVAAVQALALAFVAICLASQHRYGYQTLGYEHVVYFTSVTLWVGAGIALVVGAVLTSDRLRARFARLTRERQAGQILGSLLALVAIAIWVMPGLYSEHTIANAHEAIVEHMPYWLDEVFAALDGPYPLVGYSAQYGSLLPYPVAGVMALLGPSVGSFTAAMSAVNAICMLAAFATLRRVARSTVAGLALFLPFLATSFFMMEGPLEDRYSTVNLFSTFPLRYAGPFILLWLLARHLDGASPRAARWLFLAAGLTVLNNGDFGIPALGATVAALLCAPERPSLQRLTLEAAAGLTGALAAVSALTLVVAGSLPDLAEASCLLAFGVLVCSLPQTPVPWSQLERLHERSEPLFAWPLGQPFIAAHTRSGEPVALLTPLGHRAAYNLGLLHVTPYAGAGAMPTVGQVHDMRDALEAAGGSKVFLYARETEWPGIPDELMKNGYLPEAGERFGTTEYRRQG